MSEKLFYIPENCDFTSIVNDSNENECSPILDDPYTPRYEGILINGPKEVVWSKKLSLEDYPPGPTGRTDGPLRLMIAGVMAAKYSTLDLGGDFSDHIVVVAVNQTNAKTYYGKMARGEIIPFPQKQSMAGAPRREDYPEYRESIHTSHFNFDLVHDLSIPLTNSSYTVYATLGGYKSNVLTIRTLVQ